MSIRIRSSAVLAAAGALLAATGAASAFPIGLFVSFASDSGPNGSSNWTFGGAPGTGTSFGLHQGPASGPLDVTLLINDLNHNRPTASVSVGFTSNLTATWRSSSSTGPFALHSYLVTGSFSFVDRATGDLLLHAVIGGGSTPGFQSAVLTVPGTPTQWATTGGVLGSDALGGDNAVTWTLTQRMIDVAASQGVNLGQFGIFPTHSVGPDDFAFDLSFLNSLGGPVQLDPVTRLPLAAFNAESSFSGTVFLVPAPGGSVAVVLGLGAWAGRRRRWALAFGVRRTALAARR